MYGMAYYPETGDGNGWFNWVLEHSPDFTVEQATMAVLKIFEAEVWCQRSKVRALRAKAQQDVLTYGKEFADEVEKLASVVQFLKKDTQMHRSFEFKQYRDKLRQGRYIYATFNGIPSEYPYDEIEMELVRSGR